jgi:Zn-dependent protease with chaperone function
MAPNSTAIGAAIVLIVIASVVFWAGALSNWDLSTVVVITAIVSVVACLFLLATSRRRP